MIGSFIGLKLHSKMITKLLERVNAAEVEVLDFDVVLKGYGVYWTALVAMVLSGKEFLKNLFVKFL